MEKKGEFLRMAFSLFLSYEFRDPSPRNAAAHSVWVFPPELSLSGKALTHAQKYASASSQDEDLPSQYSLTLTPYSPGSHGHSVFVSFPNRSLVTDFFHLKLFFKVLARDRTCQYFILIAR